jgi:hypothetical protein
MCFFKTSASWPTFSGLVRLAIASELKLLNALLLGANKVKGPFIAGPINLSKPGVLSNPAIEERLGFPPKADNKDDEPLPNILLAPVLQLTIDVTTTVTINKKRSDTLFIITVFNLCM